jgi:hypothetical protein
MYVYVYITRYICPMMYIPSHKMQLPASLQINQGQRVNALRPKGECTNKDNDILFYA